MITRKQLEDAPMWAIFSGAAEDPGPILWTLFRVVPAVLYPEELQEKMRLFGVTLESPQRDDNPFGEEQPRDDVDDLDAALAFLRSKGTLCKVPDEEGSKYWRLLVVKAESPTAVTLTRMYVHLLLCGWTFRNST